MWAHNVMLISCLALLTKASPTPPPQEENDNDMTRKVLGSSVVTSVSVIMDAGNGSQQALFSDAAGKPVQKPAAASQLASPINLLNPDRYEFYTFDDNGDLVKRLMTLEEIQGIIASGDGEAANYNSQLLENVAKKDVNAILSNVQNVLKKEIESHQSTSSVKPIYDTPDVSSTWSMILPAIFGNSGDEIQLQKPHGVVTPDTITFENNTVVPSPELPAEVKTVVEVTTTRHETSSPSITIPFEDKTEVIPVKTSSKYETTTKTSTSTVTVEPVPEVTLLAAKTTGDYSPEIKTTTESQTISKNDTDVPFIQIVITENDPIETNQTKPEILPELTLFKTEEPLNQVVDITTGNLIKEIDSVVSGSHQEVTTLGIASTSDDFSKSSTTESVIKSKPTETILLILSTIKKNPSFTTELPSVSTLTSGTKKIQSILSETATKKDQFVNDTYKIGVQQNLNNSFDEINSSTVLYEPVPLFTVPSTTQTTSTSITQINKTEEKRSTQIPDYYQSSPSEKNAEIVVSHQNSTLVNVSTPAYDETTQFSLNDNVATESNIIPQLSQGNDINNNGFNDTNLIHAVDDLISQIMGFNETTIEYFSTLPSVVITPEASKLKHEELSRTEPQLTTNSTKINSSNNKTDFSPTDETDTTTNLNSLIQNTTPSLELNDSNDFYSKDDIFNFNVNLQEYQTTGKADLEVTENYPSTLINLQDSFNTTVVPTTDEKDNESLETSEDNSLTRNEISILLTQTNNGTVLSSSTQPSQDFPNKITTERTIVTTEFISTTSTDDYTTININKINQSSDENNSVSNNQPSSKENLTTVKPVEIIEDTKRPTTLTQNFTSSTSHPLQESASSATNELLSTSPSDNINYYTVTENEDKLVTRETLTNKSDGFVRITAAPISRVNVSLSTVSQDSKLSTKTTENVPTITLATTKKSIEVEPVTAGSEVVSFKRTTSIKPITTSFETISSSETTWKLISTIPPPKETTTSESKKPSATTSTSVDLIPDTSQGYGLEETTAFLDTDVYRFTELCNELSFSLWSRMYKFVDSSRSIFLSPFATTSMLAMVFLGARGATSGEMNEVLKLDDMVTFNPHSVFKNVTDTIDISKNSGIAVSVILRELYSDKAKGKLLNFYKERVRHFYDGHVEEVNFTSISDVIRRRTNLLVKRYTWGRIHEYLKDNALTARPPLAAVTASIFQTDCSSTSTSGRDGELHFVFAPTSRQRKLVPIPAAIWHSGFLAGYDPGLDATAVSLGTTEHTVSTILLIPGQQGIAAPGDGLARLEERLIKTAFSQGSWSRLLRSLIPRPGLEVQIPRFAHRSTINTTSALEQMGLKELFSPTKADLKGLNGYAHEMYLSDLVQVNYFVMCGENKVSDKHYFEEYPVTLEHTVRDNKGLKFQPENYPWTDPKEFQRAFDDALYDTSLLNVPLPLRPRQARVPDTPRLRFDRPFLYFIRHNPTGLVLHMGRFNPKLFQ